AAGAAGDGDRGREDDDPVPPQDPERSRLHRRSLHHRGRRPPASLMDPTLYVVLDRTAARGRDLDDLLAAVIDGGCRMVQLREKEWPSGRLLPLARRLRERCRRAGATFVVNDRVDLALAVEADGVHVGQEDLPAKVSRPLRLYVMSGAQTSIHQSLKEGINDFDTYPQPCRARRGVGHRPPAAGVGASRTG